MSKLPSLLVLIVIFCLASPLGAIESESFSELTETGEKPATVDNNAVPANEATPETSISNRESVSTSSTVATENAVDVIDAASDSAALDMPGTESVASITEIASNPLELEPEIPEKLFINPWLYVVEATLKDFLAQNWFIKDHLRRRRELGLALAATGKDSRRFRQETELLLRDPGISQIYTSLSLFPKLVLSNIRNSLKMVEFLAQSLAKRSILSREALQEMDIELNQAFSLLEADDELVADIEQQLKDFQVINRRKTRLAKLHNLIRKQNQELIDICSAQLQKFRTLNSQHQLQLENARIQLEFLKQQKFNQVFVAARLARITARISDSRRNFEDYLHQFIFFAARIKDLLKQDLADLEKAAAAVDKNRFHILGSLKKFPERDTHPQLSRNFSFTAAFQQHCEILDQQFQKLVDLQVIEANEDTRSRSEFQLSISRLEGNLTDFENFDELFAHFYLPELEEKPESEHDKALSETASPTETLDSPEN